MSKKSARIRVVAAHSLRGRDPAARCGSLHDTLGQQPRGQACADMPNGP